MLSLAWQYPPNNYAPSGSSKRHYLLPIHATLVSLLLKQKKIIYIYIILKKDNGKVPQVAHLKEQEDGDGKVKPPLMYEIQTSMVLYSGHIACWAIWKTYQGNHDRIHGQKKLEKIDMAW